MITSSKTLNKLVLWEFTGILNGCLLRLTVFFLHLLTVLTKGSRARGSADGTIALP